ncbi:TPA: endopeptidase La [bacterium]|nr:endopeptidase La [bacterium]
MEQNLEHNFLPVVCTRGVVYFPRNEAPLEVGRPKSLKAIEIARRKYEDFVILTSQKDPQIVDPNEDDLYHFGTICRIKAVKKNNEQSIRIILECLERVKISNFKDNGEMLSAQYDIVNDVIGERMKEMALVKQLTKSIEQLSTTIASIPSSVIRQLSGGISAAHLTDLLGHNMNLSLVKKQQLLETVDVNTRLELLIAFLEEEKEVERLEIEISQKVRERIDESQREYILREKLRTIKEELGDVANKEDDTANILKEITTNPYPENVVEKVKEELRRYEMMPAASQEASVIRNYVDWLIKVPWYQQTEDEEDIKKVEKVLNADHFGLEKVKERILEYIAVKHLTNSLKAPILCFSGPPGVGKTSLAKSIARALNRKFVKISLGGTKDESEIRGHRRTYLGSMPGRIIQGMKKAGVINPVFLLDEIDKLGSDYKGDPASALLEVLDPEQNKMFSDNYLEEPYDLSNVLFIATCNYLEYVPAPLRDRLEIINLSSYTEIEKLHIAKNHLIPKQIEQNGLEVKKIKFSDDAILHIIRYYTKESGVRQLERTIGSVCRKLAVRTLKNKTKTAIKVTIKLTKELLGKELFDYTKKEKKDQVGVCTGLAYTQYGGDILPIEVTHFEGKGKLNITGNIGDVMKESANIALGFIKSNAKKFNIEPQVFEKSDIHIHVPEGAVPKDGPSAGIALTTALVSALSNTKVSSSIAMTGEVTLRGNVLPIGGLKEKTLAAHRSGIKTVIIPKDNEKDLSDIPTSVLEDVKVIMVSHVSEVLEHALVKDDVKEEVPTNLILPEVETKDQPHSSAL